MFNIGFWEIIVILFVALLVIKPEEVPQIAKKIGQFIGKLQRLGKDGLSD